MIRMSLLGLLALTACATRRPEPEPPSITQDDADGMRARVLALLAQDGANPAGWKALGPGALPVLRRIVSDPAELPERRARAVASMAYVDHPDASPALAVLAADVHAPAPLRKNAVLALSAREGNQSVREIAPLLADPSAAVRITAAMALGNVGGTAAREALQTRIDAETDPAVRDVIQRALAKAAN